MEFKRLRIFALRFLSFFHQINIVCNFNSYQKIKFYATKSYTIAELVYTFYASFMHTKELLPYTLINSNFSKFCATKWDYDFATSLLYCYIVHHFLT